MRPHFLLSQFLFSPSRISRTEVLHVRDHGGKCPTATTELRWELHAKAAGRAPLQTVRARHHVTLMCLIYVLFFSFTGRGSEGPKAKLISWGFLVSQEQSWEPSSKHALQLPAPPSSRAGAQLDASCAGAEGAGAAKYGHTARNHCREARTCPYFGCGPLK